jgi:beta-galactosidase/beta-glucuronidase
MTRSHSTLLACFLWACTAGVARQPASAASPRGEYNFNPGWNVFVGDPAGAEAIDFDDASWKHVSLPYAWNEDDAFRLSIARLPTGVAWYRKHFRLPPGSEGKKIFLEFEGVRFAAEVWVNGRNVGLHENGVMAFGLDITDAVKARGQENVIAVRTDSSWRYRERATGQAYQWNDRNFNVPYGGINKNVTLHVADKLYQTLPLLLKLGTTGVYVYASDHDIPGKSATITVESQVRNEYDAPRTFVFDVAIQDMEGNIVATFGGAEHQLRPGETTTLAACRGVDGLNFWSWGYGYFYDVVTTLKIDGEAVDAVTTRTGFRKTEFAHGVFKLNDRVLHLKGYAQRTTNEWPGVGVDIPPWVSDFSNRMIVEGNGNLVRWMHVTPSKQDVESCDRVGLLQAMPAGDSEADVRGRRWEQRVLVMRDAIIYNRNNPSVIFYEAGNKGISDAHMAEMKELRDQLDPHGGRAMGCREMLASKVAEWGGEMLYINKSATKPLWMTEYSRDEGLRKWWDEASPPFHADGAGEGQGAVYNRNQDSHAIEDVVRWYDYWRERPGTGRRVNAGGVNIIFSDTNTHYRGSENYRRSGEVDAMRLPKDGYFAHQAMWNGWVDVEKPGVHLIGHWNYAPGTTKNVYAVSSADKVELFVNGRSLGFGEPSHRFLVTFPDVQWQPGVIKAVAYDAAGAKVGEASHETAGEPRAIRLTPHTAPRGWAADRADLALVDVEVCDAEGRRCPTALNEVSFSLEGPAEWRGGMAQGPDNCILARRLPVECGVNRVILRSADKAGTIRLMASAEGLESATLELTSHPVGVAEGWTLFRPDAALPCNLDRGPTPSGESVAPTRTPIAVAQATGGGNADRVQLSFDDNETTEWNNGGDVTSAWIRYELERPARVNQVVMKLADWRNRSYPLRILVDNDEVYRGDSERSLGYVTFDFPPTEGVSVRVELIGASTEGDAFSEIAEVAGEVARDANVADEGAKAGAGERGGRPRGRNRTSGALRIVELEIYEPLGS